MKATVDNLRESTKWLLGLIVSFGAFMQIPQVNNYVTPLLNSHPRIAPIVFAITGIAALLHQPQIERFLGIQEIETTVEKRVVPLDPNEEVQPTDTTKGV